MVGRKALGVKLSLTWLNYAARHVLGLKNGIRNFMTLMVTLYNQTEKSTFRQGRAEVVAYMSGLWLRK